MKNHPIFPYFSFKNSTKSIAKTHCKLYVGKKSRIFGIQVGKGPSPAGPETTKTTIKIESWGGSSGGVPENTIKLVPWGPRKTRICQNDCGRKKSLRKMSLGNGFAPKYQIPQRRASGRRKSPFGQNVRSNALNKGEWEH